MKVKTIHSKKWYMDDNEMNISSDDKFFPLQIIPEVADLDRDISMIKFLKKELNLSSFLNVGNSYGGYVPISIKDNISIIPLSDNIDKNLIEYSTTLQKNIEFDIIRIEDNFMYMTTHAKIIISCNKLLPELNNYIKFDCSCFDSYRKLYVHTSILNLFLEKCRYYITNDSFNYDNLINLIIMVKNAGDEFKDILIKNLPYVDRWTFLDTGSTDNTISIINEVMEHKYGKLYREPFINFRESRNRCFELSDKECIFNIVLDDTYVLNGDIRKFLTIARCDDNVDSYSVKINSNIENTIMYNSIRITRVSKNLKYKYVIHETIEDNYNCLMPIEYGHIIDYTSDYMNTRTSDRKKYDLTMLLEDYKYNSDSRNTYYIAETYYCMKEYQQAIEWYHKRYMMMSEFLDERYDSIYKIACIYKYHLNETNFNKLLDLFSECLKCDSRRPEAWYNIAMIYQENNKPELAYSTMKTALKMVTELKNHNLCMNLKVDMYNNEIPYFLIRNALNNQDYSDFENIYKIMLSISNNNKYISIANMWNAIFNIIKFAKSKNFDGKIKKDKKIVAFHIDGGWKEWNGSYYHEYGLGGSETFVVTLAEYLAKTNRYDVYIFCKCRKNEIYNGVNYQHIIDYYEFAGKYKIDVCFINRYSEYIPANILINKIKTYFISHDLVRDNEIIYINDNLEGILSVSDWHTQHLKNVTGINFIESISHSIDYKAYSDDNIKKDKNLLIYSSFANRGLLPLLQIFPKLLSINKNLKLNIFCDLDNSFLDFYKKEIGEIKEIIERYPNNIINHGFVNKKTLIDYWKRSYIWLYPCIFDETACLTAYEAAASKTLVISNNRAGLKESIGDRGIIIDIDNNWEDKIIKIFESIYIKNESYDHLINKNFEWVKTKLPDIIGLKFIKRYIDKFIYI